MTDLPQPSYLGTIAPMPAIEWQALSGKAQWDIMSAMRGPDVNGAAGSRLKLLTTAILRARMCEAFRVGGMVNYSFNRIAIPSGYRLWNGSKKLSMQHFLGHVFDAAGYAGVPVTVIDPEDYEAIIEGHTETFARYYTDTGRIAARAMIGPQGWPLPKQTVKEAVEP